MVAIDFNWKLLWISIEQDSYINAGKEGTHL